SRHTRFSRDWSSDVCSSDLADEDGLTGVGAASALASAGAGAGSFPDSPRLGLLGLLRFGFGLRFGLEAAALVSAGSALAYAGPRSEERRVGEVWRARGRLSS